MKPANIMKLGQVAGVAPTATTRRDNTATMSTRNSGIFSSFMGSQTNLTRQGGLTPAENHTKSETQQSGTNLVRHASDSSMSATAPSNMGTVTGSIEFSNLQNKKSSLVVKKPDVAGKAGTYKLIDFGSAVGIHEDESPGNDHENMMTATELEFAGYGQPFHH